MGISCGVRRVMYSLAMLEKSSKSSPSQDYLVVDPADTVDHRQRDRAAAAAPQQEPARRRVPELGLGVRLRDVLADLHLSHPLGAQGWKECGDVCRWTDRREGREGREGARGVWGPGSKRHPRPIANVWWACSRPVFGGSAGSPCKGAHARSPARLSARPCHASRPGYREGGRDGERASEGARERGSEGAREREREEGEHG